MNSATKRIYVAITAAALLTQVGFAQEVSNSTIMELDEIKVVTAIGVEQNIVDAPATMTVISGEELRKKSYNDVTDALKNVPGVYVTGGGSQQSIMLRGMSSAYTLFLIDSKPMQGGDAFELNGGLAGAQMNFLPPLEAIERIEVVRGPASSLYGSDAMGGVVNIITKRVSNKWGGGVTMEYIKAGSNNKINNDGFSASTYINAPLAEDKLSLQLTGSYLNQDESNWIGSGDSSESDPEFKRKTFGAKFSLAASDSDTLVIGNNYNLQERTHTANKSSTTGGYTKSIKNNYFATHEGKYDNLIINSYVNYDTAKNPTRVGAVTGKGIDFQTLTFNTQGTYFFNSHIISAGANYKKEKLTDGGTSSTNQVVIMKRDQYSLFAEDEWSILDDLTLSLSGRFDDNEKFGSHFSPKAYLIYHLTDELTFKGGVTSGYKAPSLRQAAPDFSGVSMGGVMIGNPDLTPETSINYEVGINYDDKDLGLSASVVAFKTDFKDKITRTSRICQPNVSCTYKGTTYPAHQYGYTGYENVDEVEFTGFEHTLDFNILKSLTYRHSYTYTKSEQKTGDNTGKPLNNTPKRMFNVALDYDLTSKFNVWTQANYRSESVSYTGTSGTPQYTFVDVGLIYRAEKNLDLKFGVYNVFNKEVTNEDSSYVLDGIKYNASFTYRF
ncbi:MAG: TonB-dependent receptor [Campylobacteraceae bacterium]|jgi:outer membrane receptor for ferrienterochelin and colicins|nr:TonB-dependent receptor [Campylobacteraceae bacterium]